MGSNDVADSVDDARRPETLSNGARLVIDPMAGVETATVGVWVGVGARHEAPDENGLAHLLEHMAFKGTTSRDARAIAEEIENVGGWLNASTGRERTGYYARVLKDDAGTAFDLIADILQNSVYDEDELAKEKDVVLQEIGEAADTPEDVVFDELQAAIFGDHPLARPILGSARSVRGLTRGRLQRFADVHYRPENLLVVASGAVEPAFARAKAEEHFGDARAGGESMISGGGASPRFVGGVRHDARNSELAHLAVAFPGVATTDEDYFATRVFCEALGGGMSSRLFQSVREQHGLAYSVYAYSDSYADAGIVGAYVGADGRDLERAAALIRAEIEAMAHATEEAETRRARAMLKAQAMTDLETPAGRAEAASAQLLAYGRLWSAAEIAARLDAVRPADVAAAAARALEGDLALAIVGRANAGAVEKELRG